MDSVAPLLFHITEQQPDNTTNTPTYHESDRTHKNHKHTVLVSVTTGRPQSGGNTPATTRQHPAHPHCSPGAVVNGRVGSVSIRAAARLSGGSPGRAHKQCALRVEVVPVQTQQT